MLLGDFEAWLTDSLRRNPQPGVVAVRTFTEAGFSRCPVGATVTFASGTLVHLQPVIVAPPGSRTEPLEPGGDPDREL
ncbi:hypothetical protein [Amycolatopsis sp. H20-H5]|uniref:hypothetical protein n=1 Tax=Amycolatopsis sp. H20-H5 TaxID=3046309 RepID=UPI002DB55772|nr:hypothetical protein [Amycolatopsis sp. H20-H5]MEC3982614.1 hypothetical protein [Amycolatopsis sp. H20-H5]